MSDDLHELPEPVRRYLTAAIDPETPAADSAWLQMRGQMKLGRWLPFRAEEELAPHRGFVWSARVAGVISGYDRYENAQGALRWKLFGLIPLVHADGPDVSRSAVGRCAAEAIWVPTALLPSFGVAWSAVDDAHITARYRVDDCDVELHIVIDARGRVESVAFDRWGDPDRTGTWSWHRFGVATEGYASFDGVLIPARGRAGWHFGTEQWAEGEFFRYEITDLTLGATAGTAR